MADLEVAQMSDEDFAAHWKGCSNHKGTFDLEEGVLKFLQSQLDWFERNGNLLEGYCIHPNYRNDDRVRMMRTFTTSRNKDLFRRSRA